MDRLKVNIDEAKAALTEKPMLATTVERFLILDEIKSDGKELSQPEGFSRQLSALLDRVSTPIEKYDLIAGRTVDRLLTPDEEKRFTEYLAHPDYPSKRIFLSSGHCTFSWEALVSEGLSGLKERARRTYETAEDQDKRVFLQAVMDGLDAVARYMYRYAEAAEREGLTAVAANLRGGACGRPKSFSEALQLLWIVTLINCAYITENPTLTLGRLDKILYPLYSADIENGRLTREEARELITDYYCKHNLIMGRGEHQVGDETNSTTFRRILNFDAPQYLILAGIDKDGRGSVNELTELFSECIEPSFKNPVVVVRYYEGMDKEQPRLWRILTDKALESSSMMFYNDNNVISTYVRMGIPYEDAVKHEHFGCNWPSLGPDSVWVNGGPKAQKYGTVTEEERNELCAQFMRMNSKHGWAEDIMTVLKRLAAEEREVTVDDVYEGFLETMADFFNRKIARSSKEINARHRRPSAIVCYRDLFSEMALDRGECISSCAKYYQELASFQMFGTVVDSIIVADKLVFIDKKLSLSKLMEAVENNFEGYEDILALCRRVEKYGSDGELSNYHAKRLSEAFSSLIIDIDRRYIEKESLMLVPCMQSDTWHLKLGETYGATPDGRRAGVPFSQNTRPSNGAAVNGITGLFNSVRMLPTDGFLSGALNLDVDPADYKGEEGHTLFAALLGDHFNRGGLHAQVSAVGAERLVEAQKDPDAHRDIRVRVTGYSGIFVDMCERLQNDVIERFK